MTLLKNEEKRTVLFLVLSACSLVIGFFRLGCPLIRFGLLFCCAEFPL